MGMSMGMGMGMGMGMSMSMGMGMGMGMGMSMGMSMGKGERMGEGAGQSKDVAASRQAAARTAPRSASPPHVGELVKLAAKGGAGARSVQNGDIINFGPPRGRKLCVLVYTFRITSSGKNFATLTHTYPRMCAKYVELSRIPHFYSVLPVSRSVASVLTLCDRMRGGSAGKRNVHSRPRSVGGGRSSRYEERRAALRPA